MFGCGTSFISPDLLLCARVPGGTRSCFSLHIRDSNVAMEEIATDKTPEGQDGIAEIVNENSNSTATSIINTFAFRLAFNMFALEVFVASHPALPTSVLSRQPTTTPAGTPVITLPEVPSYYKYLLSVYTSKAW